MGNSKSSPSFGDVYIQLNQDCLIPGDTLTGTIYINLIAPYPGSKLCLKMKGTEYAHWVDTDTQTANGQTSTTSVTRRGRRVIIENIIDVYNWPNGTDLPPGQFSFPFSFRVPDGIPGSFFLHHGQTIGEIRYRLEAFLKPTQRKDAKIKHKVDILVREPVKGQIEATCLTLNKPITTWCCIKQGSVKVKTSFGKNIYAPSEEVKILAEVDNSECKLNIKDVVFQLNQTVVLRANSHAKRLNYCIRDVSLGGIGAGQTCLGDQQKCASMVLPPGQSGAAKTLKNNPKEKSPDPSKVITPSTHGDLIKSDFHLKVKCRMAGCTCCSHSPATDLPIQIYAPLRPRQSAPIPPADWNPSVNVCIKLNHEYYGVSSRQWPTTSIYCSASADNWTL